MSNRNPELRKMIAEVHNLAAEECAKLCDVVEADCRKEEAAADAVGKLAWGSAGDTAKRIGMAARALKIEEQP